MAAATATIKDAKCMFATTIKDAPTMYKKGKRCRVSVAQDVVTKVKPGAGRQAMIDNAEHDFSYRLSDKVDLGSVNQHSRSTLPADGVAVAGGD